ncbi:UNVERIFIED_CONTAM: hypothetical protein RMT77_008854 [Armadillidium vulgare]
MAEFQNISLKTLTKDDEKKLALQDSRGLVSDFNQRKLEIEAGKNWDKFYKRNGNRFFKDRHWTTREFKELIDSSEKPVLFEVGCGVGNFFYPLLEDKLNFKIYACDISPRAIEMVKSNSLYNEEIINAFVCDLTKDEICIESESVDLVSLIFVLSAILPNYFETILKKLFKVLRPGGLLLFRDYGVYDMAMIRFGPGSKLAEKLYVRQDGTRAYYFTVEELHTLFTSVGFEVLFNEYVSRQTVNLKEGIDAQRIFVQAKCIKPHQITQPS